MSIMHRMEGNHYHCTLKGHFNYADNPLFKEVLEHIAGNQSEQITFHMAEVEDIDSAALGLLLLAHDTATKHHKHITIQGAAGQVLKMLTLASLDKVFTIQ
jgi:anti-anti-sigma factor